MSALATDPTWPRAAVHLIHRLTRENAALRSDNARLSETVARRDRRIARLNKEKKSLSKKLEEALRAGKRQASPFGRGDPKKPARRSGRKSGPAHGPTNLRSPPDHVDRYLFAPLPELCPCCGEPLVFDDFDHQYQWDLPPIEPVITKFTIEIGHCARGHRVQGRHPEQTSDALGSAACQIGPNAVALAGYLNKVIGAPFAKIAQLFAAFLKFKLATSTLVRAILRLAKKAEPAYERLHELVRTSPVVYPDETGWRIRGLKAWLHVFVGVRPEGNKVVLYVIARYRGFSVAAWALGRTYSGLLGHDGWAPYDQFERAVHQTCANHLLNRCRRLLEDATRRAVSFPRDLKAIIQAAFQVRDRYLEGDVSYHGLQVVRGRLEQRLDRLLQMDLTHGGNARLAKHVEKHKHEIFTFLKHPDQIEGTNCFAEQETRPAVIARKISGCNKTWVGAHAHEVLVSHFRTAQHAGETGIPWLVQIQRQPGARARSLPAYLKTPGHT
jgi:transposase